MNKFGLVLACIILGCGVAISALLGGATPLGAFILFIVGCFWLPGLKKLSKMNEERVTRLRKS